MRRRSRFRAPWGASSIRWSGALALVLALHLAAAWLLSSETFPPPTPPAAPEAVMLDLAPELQLATPTPLPPDAPPLLEPPASAPTLNPDTAAPMPPPETAPPDLPPIPPAAADAVLPPPAPPPPQPKSQQRPFQPDPALDVAQTPIPPAAPAAAVASSWGKELLSRLQRAQHYPELARARGDEGVAAVTFSLDRAGHVLNVLLVRSSGSPLLDDEAVAMVRRAQPLPRMPDGMPGNSITLTIPITFALQ